MRHLHLGVRLRLLIAALSRLGAERKLSIAALRRRKMRLFVATLLIVVVGLLATAGITAILNRLLGEHFFLWPTTAALASERLELVKVALLVAGGVGGAVALTVSYRKQNLAEEDIAGKRSAYAAAAAQLGDPSPTVRLAGVYALANLADAWPDQRQQCVDVLCGHLRIPWTPKDEGSPLDDATLAPTAMWGEAQVRETILTVIAAHLHSARALPAGVNSWSSLDLNLTGALISGWDLARCTFTGRLQARALRSLPNHLINLRGADLTGADLTGADLTEADLIQTTLTGTNLNETTLTGADLTGANLSNATLRGANLVGAALRLANLAGADLTGSTMIKTDLSRVDLTQASLSQADLTKANLEVANLTGVFLGGANLTRANLTRANLTEAYLGGANLLGAILVKTELTGADLRGAYLTGANLSKAILVKANLTEADLTKAVLVKADLSGANLSGAKGIQQGR